jgi:hypothetical protein
MYTKGADPMSLSADNIFSDGYAYQIASLTPNTDINGYDAFLEVTVRGSGVTSVGHLEKETSKVLVLGQNYPNPFTDRTSLPITLLKPAEVVIDLFDLMGRRVHSIDLGRREAGDHTVTIDQRQLGVSLQSLVYQCTARTPEGTFTDVKMMTATR